MNFWSLNRTEGPILSILCKRYGECIWVSFSANYCGCIEPRDTSHWIFFYSMRYSLCLFFSCRCVGFVFGFTANDYGKQKIPHSILKYSRWSVSLTEIQPILKYCVGVAKNNIRYSFYPNFRTCIDFGSISHQIFFFFVRCAFYLFFRLGIFDSFSTSQ